MCMLILDASTEGPLDAWERQIEHLHQLYLDDWGIIAFAEEANRDERWVDYLEEIEDATDAGHPPKYFDENPPWASAIFAGAQDRDYWNDFVRDPVLCNRNKQSRAEAAATRHRNFLPDSNNDAYDEIALVQGDIVPGPYEGRNDHNKAAVWRPWQAPEEPLPPPAADSLVVREASGKYVKFQGQQFCYGFARSGYCTGRDCPNGRLHRCEWCLAVNRHPSHECDRIKGKGGKDKGKADNGKRTKKGFKGKGLKGGKGKYDDEW